jgi:hypothetical protein
MTGMSMLLTELVAKGLEMMTEALPQAHRIGVLWNPTTPSHARALQSVESGLWGRKPPRRRHDSSCCRNLSPRSQQLRSAISVNPQAEAIFWTTELTNLSDKDRSRACIPRCLSEKSAISRRSTRSVTQSRARSKKIIRSFAILNKA